MEKLLRRKGKPIVKERLLLLYEKMLLIRRTELQLVKLFTDGEIPGFIHSSVGQEAVAAGVMSAICTQDTITTTHRGHGHVLAKGIELDRFFMEVMGRAGGICGGRGGSIHVADMSKGILGANGIVGGGISIALGSALAHKVRRTGGISVAFFGDGALAEGVMHECFNLAALWNLPMLFVCENNGWSEFSPSSRQFAADLGQLTRSFGLVFMRVDGSEVELVAQKAEEAVAGLRGGGKPAMLECVTRRARGHYEGDPQKYRDPEELASLKKDDPIERLAVKLIKLPGAESEMRTIDERVDASIESATSRARVDRLPEFDCALRDVYTIGSEG